MVVKIPYSNGWYKKNICFKTEQAIAQNTVVTVKLKIFKTIFKHCQKRSINS